MLHQTLSFLLRTKIHHTFVSFSYNPYSTFT
nr:MAG TPA: hypothetical protein [Caudoviricetes sp.]DAR19038.1 MAG TPA: hypothetical protein [Caudoviricetes sp.]